jgi:hypothetical protein
MVPKGNWSLAGDYGHPRVNVVKGRLNDQGQFVIDPAEGQGEPGQPRNASIDNNLTRLSPQPQG